VKTFTPRFVLVAAFFVKAQHCCAPTSRDRSAVAMVCEERSCLNGSSVMDPYNISIADAQFPRVDIDSGIGHE